MVFGKTHLTARLPDGDSAREQSEGYFTLSIPCMMRQCPGKVHRYG